jgi:hypothetical protein
MTDSTTNEFDAQVLRALAFLFKSFPKVVTIDDRVLAQHGGNAAANGSEHGTMAWLIRSGVVSGEFQESRPSGKPPIGYIASAQLTGRSLAVLRKVESATGGPLGTAVVNAVDQDNEREIRVVGELLVRRLTGG